LALAACGVVYGVGVKYLRTESIACRLTLVEGGGAPGPHVRHNFWCLFSADGGAVDLGFEEASAVPYPFGRTLGLRGAGSAAEPLRVSYDPDRQVRSFPTYAQDSVLFETTDSVALPGRIVFHVQKDPSDTLKGRVDVDEAFPLRDAWIVDGPRIMPVRPGPFEIRLGPGRPEAKGTLLERQGFEAVTRALNAADIRQPVLLYRYEGAPSLTNSDIREDAIHFGIVEPSDWTDPAPGEAAWRGVIYLPPENPAAPTRRDFEFTLRTRDIPVDREPESLMLEIPRYGGLSRGKFELFDRRAEVWKSYVPGMKIDRFVSRSPFGGLALKARYLSSNEFEMDEAYSERGGISELHISGYSKLRTAKK
jgi:hypothetical protein